MNPIRTASTVMMTRGRGRETEVFLVERAPKLRFFGGYWAFPGGVLDDYDRELESETSEADFRRCALRELFEETGVLPKTLQEGLSSPQREKMRARLLAGEEHDSGWSELIAERGQALEVLQPFCQLTTPAFYPLRYWTTFFHLDVSHEARPSVLEGELIDGGFFRPAELLEEWIAGGRRIVPPVLFLLESLRDGDIEQLFALARSRVRAVESGELYPVRFGPGISVAPLRTPTLPPAETTNTYLVGTDLVYVIDPATYEESERARLYALMDGWIAEGRRFEAILLTHHHADHIGSVNQLSRRYDLPVHAHPLTLARIPAGFRVGRELGDGDVLELGHAPDGSADWRLHCLFTPGHDRGHLVFLEDRYRAAIVGDLISTVSTIIIDPPEGHLATYLRSLERMQAEGITTLYPAHGPAHPEGPLIIAEYLKHRRWREEILLDLLGREPRRSGELLPEVYRDVDPALHPLAERSLLAGLEKLAEEGRARSSGEGWSLVAG